MKQKKMLVAACLAATALAGPFAFAAQTEVAAGWLSILSVTKLAPTKNTKTALAPKQQSAIQPSAVLATNANPNAQVSSTPATPSEVPPQVVYQFFFKRLSMLESKAAELDARGENGEAVRKLYQQTIGLTNEQNAFLLQTAADCMTDVKVVDDTAAPVIEQLAANRQSQSLSANAPPAPVASEQLTALQQERDSIVLSYRDRLETNFGAETYARLQKFVNEKISSNIDPNVNLQNARTPASTRPANQQLVAPIPPNSALPKENQ